MSGSKAWRRNSHASLPPPPPPRASALARLTSHKAAVIANSYKYPIYSTYTNVLPTNCAGYRKRRESGASCSISAFYLIIITYINFVKFFVLNKRIQLTNVSGGIREFLTWKRFSCLKQIRGFVNTVIQLWR